MRFLAIPLAALALAGMRREEAPPARPGEDAFTCGVDAHVRKGMTGTIVVVP